MTHIAEGKEICEDFARFTDSELLSSENHAIELRLERLRVIEKGDEYLFEKRRETALRSPPPLTVAPSTHILSRLLSPPHTSELFYILLIFLYTDTDSLVYFSSR